MTIARFRVMARLKEAKSRPPAGRDSEPHPTSSGFTLLMTCRSVLGDVGRGSWEQVRIPLARFFRLADGSHPAPDERFSWFSLAVGDGKGPVLVDDVELVEILR